jgi:predicted DNA-binding transcriptional regulator YafY
MNKGQKLVVLAEKLSNSDGLLVEDLKREFDLDVRSFRRYIADLREIGFALSFAGRGEERMVSVDKKNRRKPVNFTLGEVLSLHFGRTLFTFLDGTDFAHDMDDAIERLAPVINNKHLGHLADLDTKFVAVSEPTKRYGERESENINEVVSALLYRHGIGAVYRKVGGRNQRYRLQPYTLATFRQGLYLIANDVDADRVKTFAIERFVEVLRERKSPFVLPAGWNPRAYLYAAFGIIEGPPERMTFAFQEQARGYIRERIWHPSQQLYNYKDGRLILTMDVADTVELRIWLRGFGGDVEVISPLSLREGIAQDLLEAADQYK